jgi:hypothetical protein
MLLASSLTKQWARCCKWSSCEIKRSKAADCRLWLSAYVSSDLLYTMMPPPQCEKRTPMYRTIALALFAFHGFNIKSESQVLHSIDGLSSAYDTIASVVSFIHGTNLHTGLWVLFTIQSSQQIFHCVLWTDRKWSLLDAAESLPRTQWSRLFEWFRWVLSKWFLLLSFFET